VKALILSSNMDTAGIGIALKYAMEKYTDWSVRVIHRLHRYMAYPTDLYWALGAPMPAGYADLFREADVIHVVERWNAVTPFAGWRDKPLVMHHHGAEFDEFRTQELIREVAEYRAYGIVSTPDLLLNGPSLEWLPNPCNLDRMRQIRHDNFVLHEGLRIAHSPTDRVRKDTDLFLSVVPSDFTTDVIEGETWDECLARKAQADIFYDQLRIGYALSSIEAMAMGIPVVSGASDQRTIDLMLNLFGDLPFLLANEHTLGEQLEHMRDPEVRRLFAAAGTAHVERWHDESKVARQLDLIWQKAMAMR
jgi:hypothetical protein